MPIICIQDESSSVCTNPAVPIECKDSLIWARATFLADVRVAMQVVNTHTVTLQCTEDALAPVCVGQWLQQNMPCARLHLLQATGHCSYVVAPAEVSAIVRSTASWRG